MIPLIKLRVLSDSENFPHFLGVHRRTDDINQGEIVGCARNPPLEAANGWLFVSFHWTPVTRHRALASNSTAVTYATIFNHNHNTFVSYTKKNVNHGKREISSFEHENYCEKK